MVHQVIGLDLVRWQSSLDLKRGGQLPLAGADLQQIGRLFLQTSMNLEQRSLHLSLWGSLSVAEGGDISGITFSLCA